MSSHELRKEGGFMVDIAFSRLMLGDSVELGIQMMLCIADLAADGLTENELLVLRNKIAKDYEDNGWENAGRIIDEVITACREDEGGVIHFSSFIREQ